MREKLLLNDNDANFYKKDRSHIKGDKKLVNISQEDLKKMITDMSKGKAGP